MDSSIYSKTDTHSRFLLRMMAEQRENLDPNTILLRGIFGGSEGHQEEFIRTAITRAKCKYLGQGLNLIAEMYANDIIKNTHHWSPHQVMDKILKADIHLIGAPLYEGNISDTTDWNVKNIGNCLDRLEHHCGYPMGRYIRCPNLRDDKYRTYEVFECFYSSRRSAAVSPSCRRRTGILPVDLRSFIIEVKQQIRRMMGKSCYNLGEI